MREDCCLNGAGPFLLNAFKFSMLHISLSARVAAPRRLRKPRTLDAPPRSRNGQRTDGDAIQHTRRVPTKRIPKRALSWRLEQQRLIRVPT